MLIGSAARESYSADTFCLGLSFLHLLSGYEPYEILLKDVHCPSYLYNSLKKYWITNDVTSPYNVITRVIQSLISDKINIVKILSKSSNTGDYDMDLLCSILFDTLYRYVVLCGYPSSTVFQLEFNYDNEFKSNHYNTISEPSDIYENSTIYSSNNTIFAVLNDCLIDQQNSNNSKTKRGKVSKLKSSCIKQYEKDSMEFSIAYGSNQNMQRYVYKLT